MKNYAVILSLALVSILFGSCKKSSPGEVYYFKTKIEGNWVTFGDAKFSLTVNPSDNSLTDLQITAGTETNNFSIFASSSANYAAGTYNTGSTSPYVMQVSLFKEENNYLKVFGSVGPGTGTDPYYIVTITSITESEIRGTITGNFLYNSYDVESINVTEGEFVAVKR
jgi:hypothetical protein